MGAPDQGLQAADQPTAETLLTALRTIKPAERAKHEAVLNYWLSIRGNKEFPPLHDLDPLEISDAGPSSILLELISGGQDAEIRHLGDALTEDVTVQRIIDAPNPSLLSSIAKKLPIVAISRDVIAFEDSFSGAGGSTRCWVTLLPLSSCGSWVDYVYAFVSIETGGGKVAKPVETAEPEVAPPEAEMVADDLEVAAEVPAAETEVAEGVVPFTTVEPEETMEAAESAEVVEPVESVELLASIEPAEAAESVEGALEPQPEPQQEPDLEPEPDPVAEAPATSGGPGFSKLLEGIAQLTGFYGQGVKIEDPVVHADLPEIEPTAAEPEEADPEALETQEAEPAVEHEESAAPEPQAPELASRELPVDDAPEDAAPAIVAEESAPEPAPAMEGSLQSKLTEVQAKAEEAREAQLRATQALHEGLSAAYDFALDAESSPEEYLRMVEAQGLKIQLRAPMAPVAKLAFDGVCDSATIRQFEAVLAWALKVELPRGSLLERIEQAGGVPELLSEFSRAN